MSDQGFITIHRAVWDHPSFAPEPFTEREAWFWMLSAAAWEAKTVRVGRAIIDLKRGQLAFSIRFLAEKFQWSESRVRRRINRMTSDALVYVETTREATLLTICNYDKYQLQRRTDDRTSDAQNEVKTTNPRRKEEEINNLTTNKTDDVAAPRTSGNLVTPEALQLTDKLLVIAGHDLAFYPPGWATAALRVQTWLTQGWAPEIIVATVRGVAARKTGPPANSINFFEKAIAEQVAKQAAPLPVVEIKPAETLTVRSHGHIQNNSVSAVAKRLAEHFERQPGDDLAGNTGPILRIPSG